MTYIINSKISVSEYYTISIEISKTTSEKQIKKAVLLLLQIVKDIEKPDNYIKFQGFLRVHQSTFINSSRPNIPEIWNNLVEDKDGKMMKMGLLDSKEELILMIREFLKRGLKKYPKSEELMLILAQIQYYELDLIWHSVKLIQEISEKKPNWHQELAMLSILKDIELELKSETLMNDDRNGENIVQMVEFEDNYLTFLRIIGKITQYQIEFWNEISLEKPNTKKIYQVGRWLSKNLEIVDTLFENLTSAENESMKPLRLYYKFLDLVCNEKSKSRKIYDRIVNYKNRINANIGLSRRSKKGKKCIIVASGNLRNLGEIISSSDEINDFFGYKPKEVQGNNIKILMPDRYSKHHDDYIRNFYTSKRSKVMHKSRVVFGKMKNGYLSMINLKLSIIPHLEYGVQFVAVISDSRLNLQFDLVKNRETHFILFDKKNFEIVGVS